MIAATGVLHHPFTPDIPGLDTFGGDVVHTARWDDDIATGGRRIAVIGNGSTGVQIVSALQRDAAHITHFVRTPQWVIWAPMELPQPTLLGAVLRRLPSVNRRLYDALLWGSAHLGRCHHETELAAPTDPELRAVVSARCRSGTASCATGLRRTTSHCVSAKSCRASYYRAIRSDNAELVTSAIEEITPRGIRTADGRETEVDL